MSYRTISSFGNKVSEDKNPLPKIKKAEDKQALIANYKLVVIDIYADWCGPCKIVSPEFNKLFDKYNIPRVCVLAKEDVDLRLSPSVTVVPTFQFFYNGVLDSVITGADITQVETKIIEYLKKVQDEAEKERTTNMLPVPTPTSSKTLERPVVNLPPQLQKQFQYQEPQPPPITAPPSMEENPVVESPSVPMTESQSMNEGFQHAHSLRQQYYEKPAHLPMSLPIRRKM